MKQSLAVLLFIATAFFSCSKIPAKLDIVDNLNSPQRKYAVKSFQNKIKKFYISNEVNGNSGKKIIMISSESEAVKNKVLKEYIGLHEEDFRILKKHGIIYILSGSDRGIIYGMNELADQIADNYCFFPRQKIVYAHYPFRAIKFNLP